MYQNVKSCDTINGFQSDYFRSELGLMQGDLLSPILFSLYINEFEVSFIQGNCIPYEYLSLSFFNLLYADYLVCFDKVIGNDVRFSSKSDVIA